MSARFFGASVRRVEDPALITGHGRYVDDMQVPGMVEAAFVRSVHAHALIRSIDITAAAAIEGVFAVFTMADFSALSDQPTPLTFPHPLIKQPITQYPLAAREVCYVGEPVAVVLAENRYIAEDAAALVDIDYQVLPAVVGCEAALRGEIRAHAESADNIVARIGGQFGDAGASFDKAAHVFEERYTMHRGGCHSMECRGILAQFDPLGDLLTIWTSTQSPYSVQRFVAQYLERDENRVRVIAPHVGGGFGPKAAVYPEEYVIPMAAMSLGRPVKWIEDRKEHFVATTQQRDQVWDLQIAADANGKILAVRGHAVHDHGAYVPYGLLLPLTSLSPLPGPYSLEAIDISLDVVFTNATPTSPVRGAGRPHAAFVMERAIDCVARELKLDPADVRRRNFVRADQMPYQTGMKYRDGSMITYDSGDYAACLEMALEQADYDSFGSRREAARAEGRYLGIGMSSYIEDTGVGPYEGATVRVLRSGRVVIQTGAPSQGQGHATIFAQICADELGIGIEDITVESADTGVFPMGIGAVGSRVAVMAGSSVSQAAVEIRGKAIRLAAFVSGVLEDDLHLEQGYVTTKHPSNLKISLGELAQRLISGPGAPLPDGFPAGLSATAYFTSGSAIPYANGSNVAEVEVDIETGEVKLLRYSVGHDCGRMINPLLVEGQIVGGVVHGIGNALFERMIYDESGQPLTTNYGEYLLPLASEVPPIAISHMESPSPLNPIGAKGAGEGGTIPAAAAIIAAVENALEPFDIKLASHPISPQEISSRIHATR